MVTMQLPDPEQFYSSILDVRTPAANNRSDERTIEEWTIQVVDQQREKLQCSTVEKFIIITTDFTH